MPLVASYNYFEGVERRQVIDCDMTANSESSIFSIIVCMSAKLTHLNINRCMCFGIEILQPILKGKKIGFGKSGINLQLKLDEVIETCESISKKHLTVMNAPY